ncbi:MAG: PilZ domain-containing protein [Spirochaetes bacterium]|nr:PilZ domain-containing protein [Spirochaetota bacterium]
MGNSAVLFGKRVILLYPPPIIDEIIENLSNREFETFVTRDHVRLAVFLRKDDRSIVFVNIDDGLKEPEWADWIKARIAENPAVEYGILTLNDSSTLPEKYIMEVGTRCGYVTLKNGALRASETLVKTLEANEARGQRKFVRAVCPPGTANFNINNAGDMLRGLVLDISSAGMAIRFDDNRIFRPGLVLSDLQLNLKGSRLPLSGVVMGGRSDPDRGEIVLVMFTPSTMDEVKRSKIRSFIRRRLQEEFEARLVTMT